MFYKLKIINMEQDHFLRLIVKNMDQITLVTVFT